MLNHVIRFSLRNRGLVVFLALLATVLGGYLTTVLPIDVFPDLDRPRVVLLTECPGFSTEEVESLVTQPLETAIIGAPGVQAVRSQSSQGLAVVYVEFNWRTEVRMARQNVGERLAAISAILPAGIRPIMTPPSSIMGQIMHVGLDRQKGPSGGSIAPVGKTGWLAEKTGLEDAPILTLWNPVDRSDSTTWQKAIPAWVRWKNESSSQVATFVQAGFQQTATFPDAVEERMALKAIVDWTIRPRLLKEPGVAEVIVLGGDRKQYQVLVDPGKMLDYRVTLADVDLAISDNNLNASGGFTEDGPLESPVRVIARLGPDSAKVLEDLRKVPVKAQPHRTILLGQVATIREGPAPKRGDAGIDGLDAVVLTVVKQPHADTREVTNRVKAALLDAAQSLPPEFRISTDLFQLKDFIDRGIYYVAEALALGGGLVLVVLFLFLLNLRTTFITLTAIPLSLVVTVLVFQGIGFLTGNGLTINVMTLCGIAVAMGELVDDAIVDVENIFRRLRENNALMNPRPALLVVYDASREVRSAIVFGTAVVVLAFMPLFALSGVEGRLFVPLGLAYVVSILASLLVSLTVTPVLSYYLLPNSKAVHAKGDGLLLRLLKWLATPLVRFSMGYAGLLLFVSWLMVAFCVWRLTQLGTDFLPKFDEGSIQINVTLPAGSSLTASNQVAGQIDSRLLSMRMNATDPSAPIRHFVRRTGRAELDEHAEPVSRSEYIISMNPNSGQTREAMLAKLLGDLRQDVPGVDFEAEQPMAHLISHMLSGVQAEIAIKIFGDDLDRLGKLASDIKGAIMDIPGLAPPVIDPQETVDELHIIPRPDDLALYGISRRQVARFVETAMKGEVISQVLEGQRRYDLVVKLQSSTRTDYQKLGELRIDLPGGRGQVRLKDVADIPESAGGPNQVNHENARRRAVIRCNVSGRDLGGVVADIEKRVRSQVPMPEGYFVEYGGQFEAQRSATLLIAILAMASIAGIFAVLYMLYPSVSISLQILNAVPTAFIGGVLALALTGQTLSVASLVGFVSLAGIAVRNGILLVTHYFYLLREQKLSFSRETVLRGSLERLAPVLMTALTAGIGLVPLVVGGNKPGLEILYPVSTVILGGLITSTLCEFLIHPGIFWRFSGKDANRLAKIVPDSDELL